MWLGVLRRVMGWGLDMIKIYLHTCMKYPKKYRKWKPKINGGDGKERHSAWSMVLQHQQARTHGTCIHMHKQTHADIHITHLQIRKDAKGPFLRWWHRITPLALSWTSSQGQWVAWIQKDQGRNKCLRLLIQTHSLQRSCAVSHTEIWTVQHSKQCSGNLCPNCQMHKKINAA